MKIIKKVAKIGSELAKRELNYIRTRPTNLLLFLTYRCTSRCNTCVMWKREVTQKELTLEEWKRFIDSLSCYRIKNVEMFGGDALLRKDVLLPLTQYIRSRGIAEVDLVTNCNLLDEQTAHELVASGINVVSASIDGVGALHDKVRGVEGSFNRVVKGLNYLVKARGSRKIPRIVANCTVSSINVEGFEKVLDFAADAGVDDVAFEYVGEFPSGCLAHSKVEGITPEPYFASRTPSLLLTEGQGRMLKEKIRYIRKSQNLYKVRIVTRNIDVLSMRELTTGKFPNKKCYVCRYLISVDPFGNILPCTFFNNYHLGNIREEDVTRIWNNGRHKKFIACADRHGIALCNYCILGVERNATVFQELRQSYLTYKKSGVDD